MNHLAEVLKHVKTIVTHAVDGTTACPDGIASALLLKDVLPAAEVKFLQLGSAAHHALEPDFGQLFCDLTPVPEKAADFVAAGAIVLDHHAGQRDITEMFGERGVYADNATDEDRIASGAMLAYRARRVILDAYPETIADSQAFVKTIAREERVARFALLSGVRDTWRTDHDVWDAACEQSKALVFYPPSYWLTRPDALVNVDLFDDQFVHQLALGRVLVGKSQEEAEKHIREGFLFTTAKWQTRVAVVATAITSDIGELLRKKKAGVDVLVGFRYYVDGDRPKMVLSTRSIGDRPVLPFVQFYGGGGHERAAGATITLGDSDLNPYKAIQQLYNRYEERL